MPRIDLRSDTVTHPTAAMRQAMYNAEVGDDGFGDDPTVNRLQEMTAELLGKEAALFVASGTMGNLVCTLTHCRRAEEAILGARSHMFRNEQGGMAALAGVHARSLANLPDGRLALDEIRGAINLPSVLWSRTRLICLENTWNGRVLKPEYVAQVKTIARQHELKMHLDGARMFNAAVALNVQPEAIVADFDSVQFCFSKGLSAPAGSMICGSAEFIKEARRNRQLVGGAMRQVGVLAAACIVSLEEMIPRLSEDHANAQRLARGLAEFPELEIEPANVETNIVFFKMRQAQLNAPALAARLCEQGVLVIAFSDEEIRAVTHYGVSTSDIDDALLAFRTVLASTAAGKKK